MNYTAKEVFYQLVGKKYKPLFILIWVTLVLYLIVPTILMLLSNELVAVGIAICGISGLAFFIITICYFSFTSPAKKSIRTLVRTNKLSYADEILSGNYNSNDTVGFSRHLLYDKKTHIIVAYDDIIWIYEHAKDRLNKEILFCTIDGKKHGSKIDDLTLSEFLKRRSGILVGFTSKNKHIYNMEVTKFKALNNTK